VLDEDGVAVNYSDMCDFNRGYINGWEETAEEDDFYN
jgi:hypothetical protein